MIKTNPFFAPSSPKETQELTRQLVKWKKKHAALKKNNDGLRNKQRKWVVAEATLKREAEALQQEEEKVCGGV